MTKAVLEAESEGEARKTTAAIPSSALAVPASLHASLMARLDRLGPAREVAQIASVIGRQFTFALLDAVITSGGRELKTALAKLAATGIVLPEGRSSEGGFGFKHALVRDAAYESLLLTRRREWHERIARAIEERLPELAANEPDLLAHHFAQAGLTVLASDYRMRAGDRAISRSAYQEAVAHFSAGQKLAEALPVPAERMQRQLDFLLKLGAALMLVRGPQSTEVEDTYRRASEIGEAITDSTATYQAKWGLWYNANIRAKTALTRERADELMALAERSGNDDLLLEAYHCRFSTAFLSGDVAAMLRDSRIGAQTYDVTRHRHLGHRFGGHDPGVCAHLVLAMGLLMSGDAEQAQIVLERALALAESLDHPASVAHVFNTSVIFYQFIADREATLQDAQRLAEMVEKFRLLPLRAHSLLLSAWANAIGSGVAESARVIDTEIDNATVVGPLPRYYFGLAAEIMLAAGRPADGLAHLERAIAMLDEPTVGLYVPELYRLRGECLLALNRRNKAEAKQAFAVARDVARQHGATLFEYRANARLKEIGE
jgi:tetratricopeptide (TPR) repeat protein